MSVIFSDIPEALSNTLVIAGKCNLAIDIPGSKFPDFTVKPY
ncbi:MAG: hypothetical protein PF693_16985 [Spirochaetia bacterium]|nr:hypothetical protein [Spirochaetia bacterium]